MRVAGLPVTMTHADHSGGILEDGKIVNGGEPAGYVIGFESGLRLYHAGDTNLFGDMSLIAKLHSPDVALLPIGGHYTMGPREAAVACQLLGAPTVIPMHFGTFPILAGTPAELKAATQTISALTVVELAPGESYEG